MNPETKEGGAGIAPQRPGVFKSYGHGWRTMWKYFLELLLISIVSFLLAIPTIGLSSEKAEEIAQNTLSIDLFFIRIEGVGAYIFFSLLYLILLEWPVEYGISYASLKAARNERLEVKNMFDVFKNYLNAVLANLLEATIIIFGLVLLIIPGLIFACKLAFVPYLIVDKKMEAVEAVKESWRMTNGYTAQIFGFAVIAFFVAIAGLMLVGIGIVLSVIWTRVAFAAFYHAVEQQRAASAS